jgi:hypothetical protein
MHNNQLRAFSQLHYIIHPKLLKLKLIHCQSLDNKPYHQQLNRDSFYLIYGRLNHKILQLFQIKEAGTFHKSSQLYLLYLLHLQIKVNNQLSYLGSLKPSPTNSQPFGQV